MGYLFKLEKKFNDDIIIIVVFIIKTFAHLHYYEFHSDVIAFTKGFAEWEVFAAIQTSIREFTQKKGFNS